MAADLYSYVEGYVRGLDTLDHVLAQGAAFAKETGLSEAEMLDWRLAPDMFPLRRQGLMVASFTRQWVARVAGDPVPDAVEGELSLAELKALTGEVKTYLKGLDRDAFNARAEVPLTHDLGGIAPTLPSAQWVTGFMTTNFYFHLSIAYAILRSRGVQLGKRDLFAGGL